MVEDPPGDASGGLLGHVHLHGTVAGLHIEADEPVAREPVDFQQIVGILGTAVFACIVLRPFAQMFGRSSSLSVNSIGYPLDCLAPVLETGVPGFTGETIIPWLSRSSTFAPSMPSVPSTRRPFRFHETR